MASGTGDRPVALVTGAGSGVGRALCVLLSKAGYDLVLMARTRLSLEQTAAMLDRAARSVIEAGDVSDPAQCSRAVDRALSEFGRLDVLVNNAGFAPLKPIEETDPKLLYRTFGINAFGPACLIHSAWPHLGARKRGCIVNVSTMGTKDPFPGFFGYAAAKAAVNLMARSCAQEGRAKGIRAFAVAPGAIETPMLRSNFPESKVPASAAMPPERVAELIVECIEGKHDARNGQTIFVSAGRGVE
ncbi:MAG: SDR family oxidoreductase [Phycisphaeraceae bacterium]|nr:SDR family oxidoreductase [Phycisphaeraceae bacterium]